MNTIALFWGYLVGEEHLTKEQFASIDFGNPTIDTEFIAFDPLATSFFQGKYYIMYEKKFAFPHRNLPSMRTETMIVYDDTSIKIINPPVDLEPPVGILLCYFTGKKTHIKKAIDFLSKKINLRFIPCDLDLEDFYQRISKTRHKVSPISMTVSDLSIDETLSGNLEIFVRNHDVFQNNLKSYKPRNQEIKLIIREVNLQLTVTVSANGVISFDQDVTNLNMLKTIYDIVSRCVYTSSL
ncbi:MAG: hypothetical protein HZR80_15260 [Candidatus Heimdallarchaeota archaeon]